MGAVKSGLHDAIEFIDEKGGTEGAMRGAGILISQAAGLCEVCSLALDAVANGSMVVEMDIENVASITSQLVGKCWNDLVVASSLLD